MYSNHRLDFDSSTLKGACLHIKETAKILEKATFNILEILKGMESKVGALPDGDIKNELAKLISRSYEVCTFEDISNQHINKALDIINDCQTGRCIEKKHDDLLRGPALNGEQSLSQSDVDKMLNQ